MSYIRRNYEKQDYKMRDTDPGAGLGLYGVLQSGLSLLFITRPASRTEVILFFPVLKSFKNFRTSFRFFSFILRE